MLKLTNLFAVNKSRIQRKLLINAVTTQILQQYGSDGILGELSVFEAKSLQLMHDNMLLHQLKNRLQNKGGARRIRYENSIRNLEKRIELLKQLEGRESLGFLVKLYLEDIAPDFNPVFLLIFRTVAQRLFNNFIRSIRAFESKTGAIEQIRTLIGREPVFFIANHISNADHLPILFALNRLRLISPVVIGGSNLYHGLSARLLPKLNVCQLKRDDMIEKKIKWLGNPVYIETFKQHNHYSWFHNEPYLFYPEGGRSRTGKILKPKLGIIKNIFNFIRKNQRAVHFVPVSLSYTCVPEDLEIEESRKGANISHGDLIQQLTRLNREYGSFKNTATYVNLGSPIKVTPDQIPDLENFSCALLRMVRDGIRSTQTYEVAQMILNYCDAGEAQTTFSSKILLANNPDFGARQLAVGLDIFVRKKFIQPLAEKHDYQVINPDLLRQYANRRECDF
ncbi:MAG: 1-acyl-sn-glycerol-3-phosphate acyltransferase [Deltaproteobacteria bacterium]|nr:1-acyl-sn-glycerol-3-phosphate acyltransferase [Deltaproteobacteria bacterium]